MKQVKLLVVMILIPLICTGCTVEYNINISKDSIEETISVNDNITENRTKTDILNHYNMWYPTYVNYIAAGETIELEDFTKKAEGVEYYEKNIKTTNNGYSYTYKYTHDINDYHDSYVLASAFLETTIHNGYDNLVIKTSDKNFLCDYNYFEKVKVNITIDSEAYKLNYTNTSNIRNNTYTWILDRTNCDNSQIILTLDSINIKTTTDDKTQNKKNSSYTLYILCGILIILIIIGYYIFKKIKDKNENFDIDD